MDMSLSLDGVTRAAAPLRPHGQQRANAPAVPCTPPMEATQPDALIPIIGEKSVNSFKLYELF
ncbi:MAG TPA: hypothetical protein VIY51_12390 [Xanthobacteraceae bacterium]